MKTELLSFKRKARKQTDSFNGFMYVNRWATGAQHLIFNSHLDAKKFAENRNAEFIGPKTI